MNDSRTLLAIFAHPDDEVFRCGGTLALLSQHGVCVQVLSATRGQAGACGNPAICLPEELGAVRETELRCACHVLGILPPCLLDYQDGALATVSEDEAVARIVDVLQELRPQGVLTWPSHGLSGHPDHVAVSRWVTCALERAIAEGLAASTALYNLAVPQSVARRLGLSQLHATPDEQISVTVDVGVVWEQKLSAIRCHRTQLGQSPILHAPPERQRQFLGVEHFQRVVARSGQDLLLTWLAQVL